MKRRKGSNHYGAYGAKKTIGVDGKKFDSKWEAECADTLTASLVPGEKLLTQIPIRFACGAKLIIDFAIERDGKIVKYVESKGVELATYRLKMRMLRHEHPDVYAMLTVLKSERTLKREAAIKLKAKASRDAKKAKVGV